MNNLFINIFIILANIVAILLTYYSFNKNLDKSKKMLYTMISIGTMYIVILIVYFFSSLGLPKNTSSNAKNMITFTFVPINAMIFLPILIRTFNKGKSKAITTKQLNRRVIIVAVIGIAVLVSEFFYFRNIQKGINKVLEAKQNELVQEDNSSIEENTENEEVVNKENLEIESNNISKENAVERNVLENNLD